MKTQFFTGKGDEGESHLGKVTLSKASLGAELLGDLDELNSWLGLCRVHAEEEAFNLKVFEILKNLQEVLFIAQAEVAALIFGLAHGKHLTPERTKQLEEIITKIDEAVPPIQNFILPGGTVLAAELDVARTIARRTERKAKRFSESETELSKDFLQYMNRLSSILFALARYVNHVHGIEEENPTY